MIWFFLLSVFCFMDQANKKLEGTGINARIQIFLLYISSQIMSSFHPEVAAVHGEKNWP